MNGGQKDTQRIDQSEDNSSFQSSNLTSRQVDQRDFAARQLAQQQQQRQQGNGTEMRQQQQTRNQSVEAVGLISNNEVGVQRSQPRTQQQEMHGFGQQEHSVLPQSLVGAIHQQVVQFCSMQNILAIMRSTMDERMSSLGTNRNRAGGNENPSIVTSAMEASQPVVATSSQFQQPEVATSSSTTTASGNFSTAPSSFINRPNAMINHQRREPVENSDQFRRNPFSDGLGHSATPQGQPARVSTTGTARSPEPRSMVASADSATERGNQHSTVSTTNQQNSNTTATTTTSNNRPTQRGSFVVPCRARGMTEEHKNAYLTIPENVQHGESLMCSHIGCRNGGIKFCYCTVCGLAVAKRNFRQRHLHAEEVNYNTSATVSTTTNHPSEARMPTLRQVAEPSINAASVREHIQENNGTRQQQKRSPMSANAQGESSRHDSRVIQNNSNNESGGNSSAAAGLAAAVGPISPQGMSNPESALSEEERRRQLWSALFRECPDKHEGPVFDAWLQRVSAVSDESIPLSSIESSSSSATGTTTTGNINAFHDDLPVNASSKESDEDEGSSSATNGSSSSSDNGEEPHTFNDSSSSTSGCQVGTSSSSSSSSSGANIRHKNSGKPTIEGTNIVNSTSTSSSIRNTGAANNKTSDISSSESPLSNQEDGSSSAESNRSSSTDDAKNSRSSATSNDSNEQQNLKRSAESMENENEERKKARSNYRS